MILMSALFGAIYGGVVAFVWCLALNVPYKSGYLYGLIIGGCLALIFAIFQKIAEVKAGKELREIQKANGRLFFILLLLGVVTGLIAWPIRSIFF